MKSILLISAFAAASVAGCNNTGSPTINAGSATTLISPLVGKWSGKSEVKGGDLAKALNGLAGGPLTGPSTLTLNADGTGYMKVADKAERPIRWKQDGDKVQIQTPPADKDTAADPSEVWIATVSSDGKFMTIDMDDAKVKLSKSS